MNALRHNAQVAVGKLKAGIPLSEILGVGPAFGSADDLQRALVYRDGV